MTPGAENVLRVRALNVIAKLPPLRADSRPELAAWRRAVRAARHHTSDYARANGDGSMRRPCTPTRRCPFGRLPAEKVRRRNKTWPKGTTPKGTTPKAARRQARRDPRMNGAAL